MDLDEILSDKKPEPKPEAVVTNPDPVEKQIAAGYESRRQKHRDKEMEARGLLRDPETGQFAPKAEQVETKEVKSEAKPEVKVEPEKVEVKTEKVEVKAEKTEEFSPKEKAFMKAMEEERKKRQELERQLQAIAAKQQPAQPEPNAPKTFWDDPEGALARHAQQTQQLLIRNKLDTSEAIARRNHTDFQEKVETFTEMVKSNPALYQQMLMNLDPAEFAYQTAKTHKELAEVGNVDELRKKIEAETRAKVETEMRAKFESEAKARAEAAAKLPGSLTHVTGTSPATRPVWGGPTPLENILKS